MNSKTTIKLNRGLSSLFTTALAIACLAIPASAVRAANSKAISVSGNLAFGNVQVGSSAQAVMTISNSSTGGGALTVTLSLPPGFSTTFTSATLKPGKSTTATIKFSPTAGQTYGGFAVANSAAASGNNKLAISGTGVGQAIVMSGNLAFGSIAVNASAQRMLTISNSGSMNLTVTGITCPNGFSGTFSGVIAPKVSTNVPVTFSPTVATNYSGLVTVASDALFGTNKMAASGTGTTSAGHASIVLGGNLSFGNVLVNTSVKQSLVISNTGTTTLHVSGITCPAGFSGGFSGSIAARGKTAVTVTFTPTAMTNYSGAVTVTSDASSGANTAAASGAGIASAIALAGNLNFGSVIVGSPAQLTLTISNTGSTTLNVSGIHYPPGFSGAFSGAIAAGGTASFTVTFSPTNGAPYSGAITVASDAFTGVNSINASGMGIAQKRVISLSGDLNFGDVYVGNSASQSLTISNAGNSALTFTDIQLPPGFTVDDSDGVLAPGVATTVTVKFSPTNAAPYGGTLTVNSDATSGTNTVNVTGTGAAIPTHIISLSGDLNFGDVTINTAAQLALVITNSGNADLTFTNIEVPAGFSVNFTSGVLAAGSTTNVTVTFSPTGTNSYGGTITVDSDATSGTSVANASGTGTAAIVPTRIIVLSGDLNFGDVAVGSSPQLTMTISNAGNSMLTVSNINFPSGFSGSFSGTIASGATANVTVTFSPVANQPYLSTITVVSDATFGTNTITASGDAFRYVPSKARLNGLFYPDAGVEFTNSGYFSATASPSSKKSFSAKIKLAGKQYGVSGAFSAAGSFSGNIVRKSKSSLSVTIQAGFDHGNVWKGTISDGSFMASLHADAATFSSKTNPAPQAGIYNIAITGCTNAAMAPATNGTGSVTVMTSGAAKVMVTLGDGTKLTQVTAVSPDAQLPFFGSLYKNQGSILGWLAFGNKPGNELSGPVDWFKPAGMTGNYPNGFSFETALSGAKQ